jgi:hypothetical protein
MNQRRMNQRRHESSCRTKQAVTPKEVPQAPRHGARGRRCLALVHAAAVAIACAACAGSTLLDRRIEGVQSTLQEVLARGALRCAPREVAVARSHLEFADLERTRGFASRAEAHLDVADENLLAARVLASGCSGGLDAGSTPGSAFSQ